MLTLFVLSLSVDSASDSSSSESTFLPLPLAGALPLAAVVLSLVAVDFSLRTCFCTGYEARAERQPRRRARGRVKPLTGSTKLLSFLCFWNSSLRGFCVATTSSIFNPLRSWKTSSSMVETVRRRKTLTGRSWP